MNATVRQRNESPKAFPIGLKWYGVIWRRKVVLRKLRSRKANYQIWAYSLRPKLLAKSWFMKQSYKIQQGLEDSKNATIHLSFALQLKQNWGYPKRC